MGPESLFLTLLGTAGPEQESQVQLAAVPRGSGSASGVTLENVHECPGLPDAAGGRGHFLNCYLETNILLGATKAQKHSILTPALRLMRVTEQGPEPSSILVGPVCTDNRKWGGQA